MDILQSVLILGTGSAAIQIAVNIKNKQRCRIGIAGRISARSERFFHELRASENRVSVHVQNKAHISMSGECRIDDTFAGYQSVTGVWDTLILSVTNDAYISVMKQLEHSLLKQVKCVVLVSPTIGSNGLVSSLLRNCGCAAEVISLSTYYAATKGRNSAVEVLTKGVKRKIYLGSTSANSEACKQLAELLQSLNIKVELSGSSYEAESRNISLYVHPPIFMNEMALAYIFGEDHTIRYAYKFYPEGPITQYVIHDLLELWKDISRILSKLNVEPLNLLKFMNDDNYPVRPESLSRDDIEGFTSFDAIKQQYLLYIRYTSLLIDPYSSPDEKGRYFDFSAVPIQRVYQNSQGKWCIPRVPNEDYYRLKLLQGIADKLDVPVPAINKILHVFERKLKQWMQSKVLSEEYIPQERDEEAALICSKMGSER